MKANSEKVLSRYDISEEVFDEILHTMESRIEIVDDIKQYFTGYQPKHKIYYDNREYIIILEHLLAYFADFSEEEYSDVADWRQVIVRRCEGTKGYNKGIDGSRAYKYMREMLRKYYTEAEIESQLRDHSCEKDLDNIQYHFQYPSKEVVIMHPNCVKYDINGAHLDALVEIFPRAKEELVSMFLRRKKNPILKSYVNYFVGMMCRKGYRGTYNWIVHRTTKKLKKAMSYVGGTLVYANTDGFMVKDPARKLKTSGKLGDFKLEYEGTAYTYQGKNYWCYQTDNEIKGSIRYQARDLIHLSDGYVADYDIVREKNSKGLMLERVTNLTGDRVNVCKETI